MKVPLLAVSCLALACLARAADIPDAAEEKAIYDLLAKSGVPSASVAVVEDGRLAYARAFGNASIAPARAADPSTRYFIGSVSKQFTAAAILLAAEDGRLSLDDRVSKYYPGLTRASDITVRQLLSHTSGYEDFGAEDYLVPAWEVATTPDAVIQAWAGKPLDFEPGTRWQYSNTNFVLAARILEKATGEALGAYLKRRIFDPLGMKSAGDGYADRNATDAVPYTRFALGPPRPAATEGIGWYYGAAQLAMTPSDLALWDIAVLRHRILSSDSYREFTQEVLLKNGDHTGYALGIGVGEMDRIPRLSHSGEVSGFLTSNAVFPTRGTAVIVCTNEDSVFVFGTIASQLAHWLLEPERRIAGEATRAEVDQVRAVLDGLRRGTVDRPLFTSNMNSYFSGVAIGDIQASLKDLGAVRSIVRKSESLRGGMTFRSYAVQLEKGSVEVTVYLTAAGLYEQFLIAQDI